MKIVLSLEYWILEYLDFFSIEQIQDGFGVDDAS